MKYPQEIGGQTLRPKAVSAARSFRKSKAKRSGVESGLTAGPESRWKRATRAGWQWSRQGHIGPRVPGHRASASAIFASLTLSPFVYLIFTLDSVSKRDEWAAQMSHSLSLDVMEMAEVAALLDRLAAGLEATPNTSGVPSPSERSTRPEPCDSTCCWSLQGKEGTWSQQETKPLHSPPLSLTILSPAACQDYSFSDLG